MGCCDRHRVRGASTSVGLLHDDRLLLWVLGSPAEASSGRGLRPPVRMGRSARCQLRTGLEVLCAQATYGPPMRPFRRGTPIRGSLPRGSSVHISPSNLNRSRYPKIPTRPALVGVAL